MTLAVIILAIEVLNEDWGFLCKPNSEFEHLEYLLSHNSLDYSQSIFSADKSQYFLKYLKYLKTTWCCIHVQIALLAVIGATRHCVHLGIYI